MKNNSYSIEEVFYYTAKKRKIKLYGENGGLDSVDVYPAMPVPPNRKDHSTAIQWSRRNGGSGASPLKVANKPLGNPRIAHLSVTYGGGRKISAIIEVEGKNLLVHMKEDVFYPEILINGMDPGGFLRGEFSWVVNGGGHLSLVRRGSDRWGVAEENATIRNKTPIKASELEFGHAYKTLNGNFYIYLGRAIDPSTDKNNFCFIEINNNCSIKDHPMSDSFRKNVKKRISEILDYYTNESINYSFSRVEILIRPTCPKIIAKSNHPPLEKLFDGKLPSEELEFKERIQEILNDQAYLFGERKVEAKIKRADNGANASGYSRSVPVARPPLQSRKVLYV